jgi:predicted Zn-dependent peptidase
LREATKALVNDAAAHYLRPELMSIVAVGDPQVLTGQLPQVDLVIPRAVSLEEPE